MTSVTLLPPASPREYFAGTFHSHRITASVVAASSPAPSLSSDEDASTSCPKKALRIKVVFPVLGGPNTVRRRSGAGWLERIALASGFIVKPLCCEYVTKGMARACFASSLFKGTRVLISSASSKPGQLLTCGGWRRMAGERGGVCGMKGYILGDAYDDSDWTVERGLICGEEEGKCSFGGLFIIDSVDEAWAQKGQSKLHLHSPRQLN
mmetsp:Transcript_20821/g.49566  ORF Transcript_20821/g.49566 Transcript_20821/m.49566 type:complete len:209 (+) Transcript_20821:610-1236(+)